jgi:hypothetical protein
MMRAYVKEDMAWSELLDEPLSNVSFPLKERLRADAKTRSGMNPHTLPVQVPRQGWQHHDQCECRLLGPIPEFSGHG